MRTGSTMWRNSTMTKLKLLVAAILSLPGARRFCRIRKATISSVTGPCPNALSRYVCCRRLRFSARSTHGRTLVRPPRTKWRGTGRMSRTLASSCPWAVFRGRMGGISALGTAVERINGTNTRWRLGVAPCLELLLGPPTYFANVRGREAQGFECCSSDEVAGQPDPGQGRLVPGVRGGAAPCGHPFNHEFDGLFGGPSAGRLLSASCRGKPCEGKAGD